MITYLSEKRDQGIVYYMALASDNTLSATQLDEKYKNKVIFNLKMLLTQWRIDHDHLGSRTYARAERTRRL